MKAGNSARPNLRWLNGGLLTLIPLAGAATILAATWNDRQRVRDTRVALILMIGLFLYSAPLVFHPNRLAIESVLMALLLGGTYALFAARSGANETWSDSIARGVTVGLYLIALAGIAEITLAVLLEGQVHSNRISGWLQHPNLWANTVVVPGLIVFLLSKRPILRAASVPAVLTTIALTGSRSAALGYIAPLALLVLASVWRSRSARRSLIPGIAIVSILLIGFQGNVWLDRFRLGARQPSVNLFHGSEDLNGGAWSEVGVEVEARLVDYLLGSTSRTWVIEKVDGGWWSRLQQSVLLTPGNTYSIQIQMAPDVDAIAGLHGVGGTGDTRVSLNVFEDAGWRSQSYGPLEVESVRASRLTEEWWDVAVVFEYKGSDDTWLNIGPTPDQRRGTVGTRLLVRKLQLLPTAETLPYEPTYAGGVDARASHGTWRGRLSYWSSAWRGFTMAPLRGNGLGVFERFDSALVPDRGYAVSHSHNLLLQSLFERGILGGIGISLVLFGLILAAPATWPIVLAVILINSIDYTFWQPSNWVLLAVLTGWFESLGTVRER